MISLKQGNIFEGGFTDGMIDGTGRYTNKKFSLQGSFTNMKPFEVTERDKWKGLRVNAWTVKFIGTVTEPCYFRGVILTE